MIQVDFNILNQKGSPALYQDTFANRPAASLAGRIFLATDTGNLYRDTGTTWTQIATGGGPGVTPGIDDVLAVGQKFTTDRTIDANQQNFTITNNKIFFLKNNFGNTYLKQAGREISFGDISSADNKTLFSIDDSNSIIKASYNGFTDGIEFNYSGNTYKFGSLNTTSNNETYFFCQTNFLSTIFDGDFAGIYFDYNALKYYFGNVSAGYGTKSYFVIDDTLGTLQTFMPGNGGFVIDNSINRFGFYDLLGAGNGTEIYIEKDTVLNVNVIKTVYNNKDIGLKLDFFNDTYFLGRDFAAGKTFLFLDGGNGEIKLQIPNTLILDDGGTGNLLQATSGSTSGQHLKITIDGVQYVIELKNP